MGISVEASIEAIRKMCEGKKTCMECKYADYDLSCMFTQMTPNNWEAK